MKKIILTSIMASAMLASTAMADINNNYIRIDGGFAASLKGSNKKGDTYYTEKFGKSPIFSIGYGFSAMEGFRTDINVTYRSNFKYKENVKEVGSPIPYLHQQKFKSITVMANLYYDFPIDSSIKPYVTAGVGFSRISAGDYTIYVAGNAPYNLYKGGHSNNFAWQVGAGMTANLQENMDLDVSYRFTHLGKLNKITKITATNEHFKGNLRSHEFLVGLRFKL